MTYNDSIILSSPKVCVELSKTQRQYLHVSLLAARIMVKLYSVRESELSE